MAESRPTNLDNLRRARDIMIPLDQYPWVNITDTIQHAISVIQEAQLEVGRRRSLPRVLLVFDKDDELAGIVRRRDIMRGLEPEFLVDLPPDQRINVFDVVGDPNLIALSRSSSVESFVKGLREQASRPVGHVLRPITGTLKPDAQIMEMIYEMVSLNESLLPVVDGREVLGVVRSVDVFNELAQLLG